jgi:hypothetical protein
MKREEQKMPYTSLQRDILSEAFLDMEKMIFKIVLDHYKRYGGDLDELMSEAQEKFLLAHIDYDGAKGELSTYVYQKVKFGLVDLQRRNYRKLKGCKIKSLDEVKGECQVTSPKKDADLTILLTQIGEDCANIIYLILFPPCDFHDEMNNYKRASEWRNCITEYLHFHMKWSLERIQMAFTELMEAVRES